MTEDELDAGFAYLEQADWDLVADVGLVGISNGLGVTQQGAPNMTVAVSAGAAYDQQGRRVRIPSAQNANIALASNSVETTVTTPGNEKWIGIYAGATRALSDPRTDGNALPVYFERVESFELHIVQGAEAVIGTATRPALDSARILLADVRLVQGQTTITNADISTTRRQDTYVVAGTPRALARSTAKLAFTDVLGWYNAHVTGASDRHLATQVDYAGGDTWADGATNPAATVEAQLDKVITDLRATTGDVKVGAPARAPGGTHALLAGSVGTQLLALLTALNATDAKTANRIVNLVAGGYLGEVILTNAYQTLRSVVVPDVAVGDVLLYDDVLSFDVGGSVTTPINYDYRISVNGVVTLVPDSVPGTHVVVPVLWSHTAIATGAHTFLLEVKQALGVDGVAASFSSRVLHVRP